MDGVDKSFLPGGRFSYRIRFRRRMRTEPSVRLTAWRADAQNLPGPLGVRPGSALMNLHIRLGMLIALLAACGSLLASPPVVVVSANGKAEVDDGTLARLPKRSVTATAHGKTATYEGYDLIAVLKAAGVEPTESLRGKQLRTVVIVSASDGYSVVFALAELDPTLGNRQVLLVDREDGQPLPAADGPWRLVVPSDQRPARWVRQVTGIEVSVP